MAETLFFGAATSPSRRNLRVPLTVAVLWVSSGLLYTFFWAPVVRHQPYWITPGDLWSSLRGARYIQHGALSYIYSSSSGLVTLPGLELLLAPVSALIAALHLVVSVPGVYLVKPSAWFVLGPFEMVITSVAFFGVDALLRQFGVSTSRRLFSLVVCAAAMWSAVLLYGHPEDVLALGLAALSLSALSRGRWAAAGWLLGAAIAVQLYVVLLVPAVVGLVGLRRGAALVARAVVLPGFFLVAVLAPDFHQAARVLTQQPNWPTIDRPTPWVLVAPKISNLTVAAGPGRLIAVAAAILAGLFVLRRPASVTTVLWVGAAVAAGRCIFESVMVPYYVMPAAVLAVLYVASTNRWTGLVTSAALAVGLTVMTESHGGMWSWWAEMCALLLGLLLLPAVLSRVVSRSGVRGSSGYEPAGATAPAALLMPDHPVLLDHVAPA
jgi:hypothetical protein